MVDVEGGEEEGPETMEELTEEEEEEEVNLESSCDVFFISFFSQFIPSYRYSAGGEL